MIKKFLLKLSYFLIFVTILLFAIQYTIWGHPLMYKIISHHLANNVYRAIFFSKQNSNKKTLLLGDSVGRQLFGQGKQSNYFSVASTQAITMIGQYILLRNFCKNNDIDTAYLVYHPSSFQNNLDLKFTYAHFIKPFYQRRNNKYLSVNAKDLIDDIPFVEVSQIPYIKMTNWNPHYDYLEDLFYDRYYISDIAIEYLQLMKSFCLSNDIKLFVISPILRKDVFDGVSFDFFNEQISDSELTDIFELYEETIQFLPRDVFVDNMHFTPNGIKISRDLIESNNDIYIKF